MIATIRVGRTIRPSAGWSLLLATALGAGCSSTEEGTTSCGTGTTLVNGVCVITDSGTGQDAAIIRDTSAPDDVIDSNDADTADAAVAETSPSGDPCPSQPIDVNCSSTCGGPTSSCALVVCHDPPDGGFLEVYKITSDSDLPVLLRTPDKPGIDAKCGKGCSSNPNIVYGMIVKVEYPGALFRASVAPPWTVGKAGLLSAYCDDNIEKRQCIRVSSGSYYVLISTRDPNAPSRNVIIEKGDTSCP